MTAISDEDSDSVCKFCEEETGYDNFPCCQSCWKIGFDEELELFKSDKVRKEVDKE